MDKNAMSALCAQVRDEWAVLSESQNLSELYRTLLMKYVERNSTFRQTRERADKVLLPQELLDVDELLGEFERNTDHSQKSLNLMVAENEPAQQILQRNISALERAIEGMDRLTAKLDERIKQAESKKRKHRAKKNS
jgi:hypothetical protein